MRPFTCGLRGGLMVGGFEAAPLPADPRAEPASFSTDDVPLDPTVLRSMAGQVSRQAPTACCPVAEHRGCSHDAGQI